MSNARDRHGVACASLLVACDLYVGFNCRLTFSGWERRRLRQLALAVVLGSRTQSSEPRLAEGTPGGEADWLHCGVVLVVSQSPTRNAHDKKIE